MSDSTTNLDLISASQSQKEVTANALFDAGSPATLGGRRAATCAGLTWGYYGGNILIGSTVTAIPNGTVVLTASTTNYVELDPATGTITAGTTVTPGAVPLYEIVCGAAGPTSYIDQRVFKLSASGGVEVAVTSKGDLQTHDGSNSARLPVGTNGQVLVADSSQATGLKWANAPFDLTAFYPGVPSASAKVTRVPVARAVAFQGNFAGSYAVAMAAATASTVFDVRKNGVSVGSITFAAGASTATFSTPAGAAVNLAAGDYISITAPATADATLADIGFVLAGTR